MNARPTILAISGSLRANSSNHAVINTAIAQAGDAAHFILFEGLSKLPHFDDNKDPAQEVVQFRQLLREADGVLISSPEYAFGVPGTLKNALDWTVSTANLSISHWGSLRLPQAVIKPMPHCCIPLLHSLRRYQMGRPCCCHLYAQK